MKKIFLLVFVLITLLFGATVICGANGNLVQNGSFENGTDSIPAFWQTEAWDKNPGTTEYKIESGNAHSGNRFVTIINNKENDSRFKQTVNVAENKMYKLSCWVKAADINKDKKGANISIEGKLESSPDVWETNGAWQQTVMYAKTGPGINTITVTVGLGTYGSTNTGRASFDDVAVEEVSSIPEGAVVCNLVNESQRSEENTANTGGNSVSSVIGWILFVSIFVIIIGFILYRSVVKVPPQGENKAASEGEAGDELPPADTNTEGTLNSPANTQENKQSDDLL